MNQPEPTSRNALRHPIVWLALLAVAVLGVSLAVAPLYAFRPDVRHYWTPWSLATSGFRPWAAYSTHNCNYPPLILYVLTVVEAIRAALGVDPESQTQRLLLKLPNILAQTVGAACLYRAFAASAGRRVATLLAAGWLTSLNLFVNAALWAQWDVILALLMLLALLALRRRRYVAVGVWAALAMAAKVQAIFLLPVLGAYLLARRDWRAIGLATAGAAVAAVIAFAPMAAGGRLRESTVVYVASVDTFPRRSVNAWNVWGICNTVELRLLGRRVEHVVSDLRPVWPAASEGFTYKRLGMVLFGSYVVAMLVAVARRRTLADVVVGVPLCGVAMFLLATQMHERYLGPPAALMVLWLALPTPYRWHFAYWTLSAALNQFCALARFKHLGPALHMNATFDYVGVAVAIGNLAMFAHLSWLFFSRRFAADARAFADVFTSPPRSRPAGPPPSSARSC